MQARAPNGACLEELVKMAIAVFKAAAQETVRTRPGRPPQFPDWQIGILILTAVLYRRKSKSAQYRVLDERRTELMRWLGMLKFPVRSTYFARYRQVYRLFQSAIRIQGRQAIAKGFADPSVVAVDKSVIAAKGVPWPRQRGRPVEPAPRGVDREAGWTKNEHDGWVWGYGFETVVTAPCKGAAFPLLASAAPANLSEHHSFKDKIPRLPRRTRHVLADGGYDSNAYQGAVEYNKKGQSTGRHFLCPMVRRGAKPEAGRYPQRGHRGFLLIRRKARLKFFKSRLGQLLYKRRSKTIEPFHDWFKNSFELTDRVWHRGLLNNQTQLMAAMAAYQLLVLYNYRKRNRNAQIQATLDRL